MVLRFVFELRRATDQDLPRVMQIWREAVDATHSFLSLKDRSAVETEVSDLFSTVPLVLAVDGSGTPQGFMFVSEGHLEALFVDPRQHGKGVGKALVDHPGLTTDVNEQNSQALAFYKHMGFEQFSLSTHDGQGRPYPLIHFKYRSAR